jgi:hypothetical protein
MNNDSNYKSMEKMPNGVPRFHHNFMKDNFWNDDDSTDAEMLEFFVAEGVAPEHAAQYVKNRKRYQMEFGFKDDGTPRFPLKTEADREEVFKLQDRYY